MEGSGTVRFVGGAVYEGEWKEGKQHGNGKHVFATGDVYEGEWRADDRHGSGSCRYSNGNAYDGQWIEDRREGHGTLTYASGDVYEGGWSADRRHGRGMCRYASGDVFVGNYEAGRDVGEGALWSADGKSVYRLEDGNPTRRISFGEAARIKVAGSSSTASAKASPLPSPMRAPGSQARTWTGSGLTGQTPLPSPALPSPRSMDFLKRFAPNLDHPVVLLRTAKSDAGVITEELKLGESATAEGEAEVKPELT